MLGGTALVWLLPGSAFGRGVLVGVLVTMTVVGFLVAVLVGSGQLHRLWGLSGERETAKELESRRQRRRGWFVVHGLVIGNHEIDHIAVGPGGILAIETKWTNNRWRIHNEALLGPVGDPLLQARRSARQVQSLLASTTGGGLQLEVDPVLVVWGPGCPRESGGQREIQGVEIYSARDMVGFRRRLDERRLEDNQWRAARDALKSYAAMQSAAMV
jgi:hypothetical protein